MNVIGKKFNKLTVLSEFRKNNRIYCKCKCDCGEITEIRKDHLGRKKSCGCDFIKNGGLQDTRLYKIWSSMHSRCECKTHRSYNRYKDRPICEEWHSQSGKIQTGLFNFVNWAIMNGYQENLSLDRIDNRKGYSPENCRWVTIKEQARNTTKNVWIEYNGQKKILCDWCEELGIPQVRIQHTVKRHNLTYAEAFDRKLYYKYNPHNWTWEKL